MPRALITGVTGQDGTYLRRQLSELGWEVHGLVRPGYEGAVSDIAFLHPIDLLDGPSLEKVIFDTEPDYLFNLAAISSVAQSWESPVATGALNGLAPIAMMNAALRVQTTIGKTVRFVQASSSEIFGAARDVPQAEATAIAPVSPYGTAKAYAHLTARVFRSRGLFTSNCILYNHESPLRPEQFVTRKITAGVAKIARGKSDELLLGNLDAIRDWGWAPDYVDAMVRAATADDPDDFIVATGVSHSVREFVVAAFAAAGVSDWEQFVGIDERFARPSDAPEMRGDPSHITDTLGWRSTKAFTDIVASMVESDLAKLDAGPSTSVSSRSVGSEI